MNQSQAEKIIRDCFAHYPIPYGEIVRAAADIIRAVEEDGNEVVNMTEAARRLNMSPRTIRRWRDAGKIHPVGATRTRFRLNDVLFCSSNSTGRGRR